MERICLSRQTTRDAGSIPGSGRSPGVVNSTPLHYSCLENPMDRGPWQATVHGTTKIWTQLSIPAHGYAMNLKRRSCREVNSVQLISHVLLFATLWTIAHQAPLFMEFSRQEYWSGLSSPTPGDLPDPGIKLASPVSPALAGRFFATAPPGKALVKKYAI